MFKHYLALSAIFTMTSLISVALSAQKPTTDNSEANATQIEERLPLRELRVFTQVFEQIRRGYVEEVKDTELLENAIAGLLLELDPHSAYLNESDYDDLQESSTGEYSGLGLEVGAEDGMIKIISPIDDTPAAKAGIKAGDLIVEVDGMPVRGMALQKAIDKLRGEKGTSIDLRILRDDQEMSIDFTIIRDTIQLSSVRSRVLEPGYGYVRVSQFQTSSGDDFKKELRDLKQQETPLKGVIIDLRNNPGGLVPASVEISDAVLDGGTVVYTEGRLPSSNSTYQATSGDILEGTRR
jgi:carboxyl-terminal processing protease